MKRLILIAGVLVLVLSLTACQTDVDDEIGNNVRPPATNFPPRPDNPPGHIGEVPSLGYIWAEHFPLGNIVAYRHHRRHSDIGAVTAAHGVAGTTAAQANLRSHLLRRHFVIMTAEDEMKPDQLRSGAASPGSWVWNRANNIVNFTHGNDMRLHGHVLAWHSQTPAWMFAAGNRAQAITNLRTHIETVMRRPEFRYIESWEVLNEVIWSGVPGSATVTANNWRNFLRGNPGPGAPDYNTSGWFSSIGSSATDPDNNCFIWIAFTTARRVADEIGRPDLILYYNDYNEEQPGKRMAIYHMVREMNTRFAAQNNGRRLIDAVGMQGHYHVGDTGAAYPWPVNVANVRATLEQFARLGIYVSITELDITVGHTGNDRGGNVNTRPPGTPPTAAQLRQQAVMYAQLFQIFRDNAQHLRRVSFWGIDDPGSWRHRGSPHLWDGNLRPKEAFWAVAAPDAFVNPANGQARPAAEINAFLANPRASGLIPEIAWD
ncbi:MAG: endo-1,4-beta-xylanase [Treponema sp.]|nr:endo-1,4-beta-xylanase [Treponema sp.]